MNNKKKKMRLTLFQILFFILILFQTNSIDSYAYTRAEKAYAEELITYSQEIGYRYKIEDGKIYRRLYNYYTQQWIGEWELCP